MSDGLEYIRETYKVPAKIGVRVTDAYNREGVIVGPREDGHYLRVRLDGETRIRSYHPTWKIKYHEK